MAVTLKGNPITLAGAQPTVGEPAPNFSGTAQDLSSKSLSDFAGKVVIISSVPSLDTGVCDASTRKFNEEIGKLDGAVCLTVSADLPFAAKRWCGAAGVENVETLSTFRDSTFPDAYGLTITDGPLEGVLARCVLVVDKEGKVTHRELVPEIAQEPDYDAALKAAKAAA